MRKLLTVLMCLSLATASPPLTKQAQNRSFIDQIPVTGSSVREVHYGRADVIPVRLALHIATVIDLPAGEKVKHIFTGDKEQVKTDYQDNLISLSPIYAGAFTNLHIVTLVDNEYTILAKEVGNGTPDVRIIVTLDDPAMQHNAAGPAKWVSAQEAAKELKKTQDDLYDWRTDAKTCNTELAATKKEMARKIEETKHVATVQAAAKAPIRYQFAQNQKPFFIQDIWGDPEGTSTRFRVKSAEGYAIFEYRSDGTPSIVMADCAAPGQPEDVCVVDHPIWRGYLAVGKKNKSEFYRTSAVKEN